jgi:hypothetical protein
MQPEISQRCLSCGVTVREHAMFCPECGRPLAQPAPDSIPAAETEKLAKSTSAEGPQQAATANESSAEHLAETIASSTEVAPDSSPAPTVIAAPPVVATDNHSSEVSSEREDDNQSKLIKPHPDDSVAEPSEAPSATVASERQGMAKARETLHRASTATRGALKENVKRVEKVRHASSVVLEEAHYDPSLRFVLIALALFIIFAGLLLLSKAMG